MDDYRIRYVNLLDHPVTLYAKGSAPLIVPPNTITTIAGGTGSPWTGPKATAAPPRSRSSPTSTRSSARRTATS
ncbi:MAG TPA: hypothetical protein VEN82_03520 [Actinomycetota bacterium]|nr:hypothetical protein [Actinomycetota bacterium]